jgi:hypothetical protein
MRGLKSTWFRIAVFATALLGLVAGASAQQDPQTRVFLDNVTVCPTGYEFQPYTADPDKRCVAGTDQVAGVKLTAVTLSRPELATKAGYDVVITNNTTNELNRLYFTLTFIDNNNDPADNPSFNTVLGADFACTTTDLAQGQTVSCTSNISLNATNRQQKVVVVVNTPKTGTMLTVTGSAGGYEGKSTTGNGCCASPFGTVFTSLIDSVADTTFSYTVNAITFVKGSETSRFFTGNSANTTTADPFTTDVAVSPFSKPYDIGRIQERSLPANNGTNCKTGNRFKSCGETFLSLPQVAYEPPAGSTDVCTAPMLGVTLRIDASLIKGSVKNFDVTQVKLKYTDDVTGEITYPVPVCASGAAATFPCTCERSYTVGGPISIRMINTKNGFLSFD